MKINANFHAINKYCMKKNLTPNSDLSYWLQFGFPKETKTIEIKDDEGKVSTYRIKENSTFNIITEFENTSYVICYCKKMF